MKLLVCGGAGFIGSNFVHQRVKEHGDEVVVLDKLTYAGRLENLQDVEHTFVKGGIEDAAAVAQAIDGVDAVVNFAAETHVDRSIAEPDAFVKTHAVGTFVLLEAARERGLRYLQVSTDEVYGSIEEGSFTEESPLEPSSPYSATKTGADLLVQSYARTFGMETVICRGSNNYGPNQYPEKLIPLMVLNAMHGDPLPVYGDGMQVRNWLYVTDFCAGIGHVLAHGATGEVYNVGGPDECANIDVVRRIIELTGADESLLTYVEDRPGHDRRYSLGSEKVRALGWEAKMRFAEGLDQTVAWYRDNRWWWEPIRSGAYKEYYARQYGQLARLSLGRSAQRGDAPARALLLELQGRVAAGVLVRLLLDDRGRLRRVARIDRHGPDAQVRLIALLDRLLDGGTASLRSGDLRDLLLQLGGDQVRADLRAVLGLGLLLEIVDDLRDLLLLPGELVRRAVVLGGLRAAGQRDRRSGRRGRGRGGTDMRRGG